jgi:hypothetical protein
MLKDKIKCIRYQFLLSILLGFLFFLGIFVAWPFRDSFCTPPNNTWTANAYKTANLPYYLGNEEWHIITSEYKDREETNNSTNKERSQTIKRPE